MTPCRLSVLLVVLLLGAAPPVLADTGAAAPPMVASVVVAKAKDAVIADRAAGYGAVVPDPNDVVAVNAPFAAVVAQVFVRPGASVQKGQKLVALETTPAQAAAFDQAQAAVSYARGELAREQHLLSQQLATHAQVAQARTALTDAEAKLHALQSVGAGQQLTVLTATTSGVVSAVTTEVGQHLTEGAGILTLSPATALVVRLGVEPENADAVQPGMTVKLQDVMDPGQGRTGTVMSVSAVVNPTTRLRDVLVRIKPNPAVVDPPPAAGTFLKGTIILGKVNTVAVPQDAILMDTKGTYLFVVRSGLAQRINVTTGISQGGLIGVRGAIKPGDEVVVQGNYELTQGMHVQVVAR